MVTKAVTVRLRMLQSNRFCLVGSNFMLLTNVARIAAVMKEFC